MSRSGDTPPVVLDHRRGAAMVQDDSDEERWLDEGGSFTCDAVTR